MLFLEEKKVEKKQLTITIWNDDVAIFSFNHHPILSILEKECWYTQSNKQSS